jgi:hypothetical protein
VENPSGKATMYNKGGVFIGIIVLVAIVTSPLWYNAFTGRAAYVPELKLPDSEKRCVEEKLYMREHHADLLNAWKQRVVREGLRTYTSRTGKSYDMSLTGTCMKCHSVKTEFCDRCHAYVGVQSPSCWDCHNEPRKTGISKL